MFDVVLYHPEIPSNTGNIIRLCANTGAALHLVKPLGFSMEDRLLRRAGLDYREFASVAIYETWAECLARFGHRRIFAVSVRGSRRHDGHRYAKGDAFLFGPESEGLPKEVLESFPDERCLRLPMMPGSRSLNLSNAVAVVIYEAWRHIEFDAGV